MTDLHDGRGEGEDESCEGESRSLLQGSEKVRSGSDIRLIVLLRSTRSPRAHLYQRTCVKISTPRTP
jgi:hypothetical protein